MKPEERFLKYVAFDTTSDPESDTCPSTPNQLKLAAFLVEEMKGIGLSEVRMDENGYVYGRLPATPGVETETIGLIAHMDTSPAVSGADIRPRRVHYEGGEIRLNDKVSITPENTPNLARLRGHELIVTDGTTLLGSDDKSGISEVLTAVETLIRHPEIPHGEIAVGFTPDEEIGRGADRFDVEGFRAAYAYTVDGGPLGFYEYENFNAAGARLLIHGLNIHPGSAKDRMKNAVLYAAEFIEMLPAAETPAHTEGYEGFYHVDSVKGNESEAEVQLIIRDHDMDRFEKRKAFIRETVAFLQKKYGAEVFELELEDSYYNMKEQILPHPEVLRRAENAFKRVGITPEATPVRGGTDGARLSYMGLPCPNLSTGGGNFHGVLEYVSIDEMNKMVEVLVELCRLPE